MNIRILAAAALALAILAPTANAASEHGRGSNADRERAGRVTKDDSDKCPNGNLNLGSLQCVPFGAKVNYAWVVKHVAKPTTAFSRMTAIQNSHNEM